MLRLIRKLPIVVLFSFLSINLCAQSEMFLTDTTKTEIDSLNNNIFGTDSLSISDSIVPPRDSLIIIGQIGFSKQHNNIEAVHKKEMDQFDFRFAGDIFSNLPFGFLQDLGNAGQPSELKLYGFGFNSIGFSQDGIGINDRITNSYDLNHIQSEYIDSLEIIPLSSGFLYNNRNNLVSVNFLTRDSISTIPYSKIRFYQAPNSEEYLDVILNAQVFKRLTASFEVTTQTADSYYKNSEFNSWKASGRLRYMFSNKFNLIGSYDFSTMKQGLNGGVNLEELKEKYPDDEIDEQLYNSVQAPVYYGISTTTTGKYSDRYQKSYKHNYTLKALGNFIPNSPTDVTFYYQFYQKEFRQNEVLAVDEIPYIFNNNKYNNLGVSLRQVLNLGDLKFDLLANYENTQIQTDLYDIDKTVLSYSMGGKVSYSFVDNSIIPSLTMKQLNYDGNNYFGLGFDLLAFLNKNFSLFTGLSSFEKPYNIYESAFLGFNDRKVNAFEAGLKLNTPLFKGSASYIKVVDKSITLPYIVNYSDSLLINEVGGYYKSERRNEGFNLNGQFTYSNILLLANLTYLVSDQVNQLYQAPDYSFVGGIYYVDTLFNDNLKLKTGVTFKYSGIQDYYIYDFQHSTTVRYQQAFNSSSIELLNDTKTESGYQFDLFLAGTIQDAAIVYLVFENITGSKYYISPYYPKQSRGFKVGISWEFFD